MNPCTLTTSIVFHGQETEELLLVQGSVSFLLFLSWLFNLLSVHSFSRKDCQHSSILHAISGFLLFCIIVFSCRSCFMHLITVVVLLHLFSSSVSSFFPNLGSRAMCSAWVVDSLCIHAEMYWCFMFLSSACPLLFLFHFWQLPLYCFHFQGSAHCCPSCISASCTLACDLDPDSYSCFTWIFLFLFSLPFYAPTISERAFFPLVLLPTLISKFLSKSHTTKPFKKHLLFLPPYLVYQHCQATFYYAGNKKCLLRRVPSSQNVNPHMYIQSTLLFFSFPLHHLSSNLVSVGIKV